MGNRGAILILEDSEARIAAFRVAVASLGPGWRLHLWHEAPAMIAECGQYLSGASLISLDHDLMPRDPEDPQRDPGNGLLVARHLAGLKPVCPVLIHTGNETRRQMMFRELQYACWKVEALAPGPQDWIQHLWLARARALTGWRPQAGA